MKIIQCYNPKTKTFEQPVGYKVRKLLELGCIKKVNEDEYLCLPILGYNVNRYSLTRLPDGNFQCQCQGFRKYNNCAHRQALYLAFKVDEKQGSLF